MPSLPAITHSVRLRRRIFARLLVAASLVTIVSFTFLCAFILYGMRRGEEGLARQSSENLAVTIDADISRNIEILDLSLRAAAGNILSPEIDKVSREVRHLILFDHAATARHFGSIQVFDASGTLIMDASSLDPAPVSVANQEFFKVHAANPGLGLFISKPVFYRGAFSIVLSRIVTTPEGIFRGVVAGAIRFSYFNELIGRLRLDPDDLITVVNREGTVLMRIPFDLEIIGSNLARLPTVRAALNNPRGESSGTSIHTGKKMLFVWRGSTGNVVVLVGKTWDSIYSVWREQALRIGAVMGVLALVAAIITLFLAREIKRRAAAERRLEQMATTDSLTGLRNRRKFDLALDLEWRRCARSFSPMSLLLIDVDHFKSYNDRFGHPAGDRALALVGSFIAASGKRPGDCAARYGGEEFALLLPETGHADALKLAETIRERTALARDAEAPFTVSIGVATLTPDGRSPPSLLVELADGALYEAKRGGRNRVQAANNKFSAMVA